MTNAEFLTKVSTMQKEFKELYDDTSSGLAAIREGYIQVTAEKFHELERESLLEHITKIHGGTEWHYHAMTPDGVKIIALEDIGDVGEKK